MDTEGTVWQTLLERQKAQQQAKSLLLTLNLLTTTIFAPPSNAIKWQMGFNSVFKGLIHYFEHSMQVLLQNSSHLIRTKLF
jgi:hypothetical protein